jgi:hypothetical protein
MNDEFKPLLNSAYFQLKEIAQNVKLSDDEIVFAEEILERYFQTFDGWKQKGKFLEKGEKSFISDPDKGAIFHSLQLKKNYGQSEYCRMDEELGTNHFGV